MAGTTRSCVVVNVGCTLLWYHIYLEKRENTCAVDAHAIACRRGQDVARQPAVRVIARRGQSGQGPTSVQALGKRLS